MNLKDILLHLRFPFSVFLLPIFLLALSLQAHPVLFSNIAIFIVLHFFIYPASNAYNSYFDKDEGSIGGLENPPKVDIKLWYAANIFDLTGIIIAVFTLGWSFAGSCIIYILISRMYSYDGIKLKKFPVLSWLVVGVFQGGFVFMMTYFYGQNIMPSFATLPIHPMLFSTLLLWSIYPITQIYQHDSDAKAGVTTMSMLLGKKGTFILTIVFFSAAMGLGFLFLSMSKQILLTVFCLPVAVFTLWWFVKVLKDPEEANFRHTMQMNLLSSFLLNVCFAIFNFM